MKVSGVMHSHIEFPARITILSAYLESFDYKIQRGRSINEARG